MRQKLTVAAFVMTLALAIGMTAISVARAEEKKGEDEKAIRAVVEAWAKAYNAGEAKALAALFTEDAEIVGEDGNRSVGRGAIEEVFAGLFQEEPKGRVEEISIQSLQFLGPTVAIEDGVSTVTHESGGPPERSRYTVVHVKQDGKWLMASARDLPAELPAAEEQLKALEGLIGEWIDEGPDALIVSSYRWADDCRYILGEFKVQVEGSLAMRGTQRIGWDPLAKQIRSWVFDSEGGFAGGLWTRNGDQWIAKMTGVTHDGKAASSTNIITILGKERMTWQSRDRVVGGEAMPDIEEIPVVRRPPKPTRQ